MMRQPRWMGVGGRTNGRAGLKTNRRQARLWLEPLEERALLSTITEYPTVSSGAGPTNATLGSNGSVYFSEFNQGAIGSFNPTSGTMSQISIPTTGSGVQAQPYGIATGSGTGGPIYFTQPNLDLIGVYNPTTSAFSSVSLPTAGAFPQFITQGASGDSNLYFTEAHGNNIGILNPSTNAVTEVSIPTPNAQPYGITTGPGGNIYFTEETGNAIGEYNVTTHALTQTPVPTGLAEPSQITTGPDGNIWFTEFNASQIGELNVATNAITEYPTASAGTTPTGIVSGPDGLLYFTEDTNGKLGTINPTTHAVADLSIPTAGSQPYGILTAPNGNLYFTESSASQIANLVLSTNLMFATQPGATVTAGTYLPATIQDQYATGVVDKAFTGNVTVSLSSNPSVGTLGGTLMQAANQGVATFPDLQVTKAGVGYELGVSAPGFTNVSSTAFSVTPAAASQLVVVAQPPASMVQGATFGVAALVEDPYGNLVSNYSGNVILAFAANPGGATLAGSNTAAVSGGVAQFPGLSITSPGAGYVLEAAASGLSFGHTAPFTILGPTPPPPTTSGLPTVIGEQLLFNRKFNKRGKPIGRPVFVGFGFTYSTTMNAASVSSPGNYQLDTIQIRRFRRQVLRILHPLAFRVNYVASTNSVQILLNGRPPFVKGGQITLIAAPPSGIESAAGVFLDGNNAGVAGDNGVFQIGPHARNIS